MNPPRFRELLWSIKWRRVWQKLLSFYCHAAMLSLWSITIVITSQCALAIMPISSVQYFTLQILIYEYIYIVTILADVHLKISNVCINSILAGLIHSHLCRKQTQVEPINLINSPWPSACISFIQFYFIPFPVFVQGFMTCPWIMARNSYNIYIH